MTRAAGPVTGGLLYLVISGVGARGGARPFRYRDWGVAEKLADALVRDAETAYFSRPGRVVASYRDQRPIAPAERDLIFAPPISARCPSRKPSP
jgi:hypothetical protein